MLRSLLLLLLLAVCQCVSPAVGVLTRQDGVRPLHTLTEKDGTLHFSALQMGAREKELLKTGSLPLYMVDVKFDVKTFDPASGITLTFDPKGRTLVAKVGADGEGSGIAWGKFDDKLEKTGWGSLMIETSTTSTATNDVKMYAAGYAEGLMTAHRISQFYSNSHQLSLVDESATHAMMNIRGLFEKELDYLRKNANFRSGILSVEPPDPYWKHARYMLVQMWGILDAYNFCALSQGVLMINMIDMFFINSDAEMPELMEAYTPKAVKERRKAQAPKPTFLQQGRMAEAAEAAAEETMESETERERQDRTRMGKGWASAFERRARERGLFTVEKQREWAVEAKKRIIAPPAPLAARLAAEGSMTSDMVASDKAWEKKVRKTGHCSAFVRATEQDLYVGHTTWNDYSKMTRVFKYYKFPLPGAFTKAEHVGMSSYPGCVSSTDDYYILSSGLVVADTSLEILNPRLYDRVAEFPGSPHLPTFMHVMIANRLANTAVYWTDLFNEENVGTGNAQWLVADYKMFKPGEPLPDNSFWVLEMVPGLSRKQDMSAWVRTNGYFASYNRPFFAETRAESGHADAEAKHGALYSWGSNPRAAIFASIGGSVSTMFDMRNLMNRNGWPKEGVLPNEPGHAISARMDLDASSPIPNGGIDAKVTSRCLVAKMQCQAISGPTHSKQSVFEWRTDDGRDLWPGWPRLGLPRKWDFSWVQMTPSAQLQPIVDISSC